MLVSFMLEEKHAEQVIQYACGIVSYIHIVFNLQGWYGWFPCSVLFIPVTWSYEFNLKVKMKEMNISIVK